MTTASQKAGAGFARLHEIMERLLAPDGCPWDREQSLATLKPFLIEEAYEVLEAMETGSPAEHCDELGDLLFQIVFQSALRQRAGDFDAADVCAAIADKLVRRHPHVFGDTRVSGSAEVLRNWETIKAQERAAKGTPRALSGVPRALPQLMRALRVQEKASRVGFDWPDPEGPRAKVAEELAELDAARTRRDRAAMQDELGDLLFAVVNLARKLEMDPEESLGAAVARFCARFEYVEERLAEKGRVPVDVPAVELDVLWEEAKRELDGRVRSAPKK
jgi:MazG family protein